MSCKSKVKAVIFQLLREISRHMRNTDAQIILILCFLRLHTLFRSIACKIFRFSFYTDHTDRIVIQGIGRFFVPQDFHACIFEAFYQFLISLMINLHILMVAQHTAYRCDLCQLAAEGDHIVIRIHSIIYKVSPKQDQVR